ncbi:MAG: potassium channel protein [Planctomycetes bacterium]|nr:potassium channel protein [Planctomycetota bacterium]
MLFVSPALRFILAVVALFGVFIVGSIGYILIEADQNLTPLDAAYMTAITLSTVGYTEVWKLSDAGRLWTIGVIVFGIGTVSVAFTSLIALLVGGELRSHRESKKMEMRLRQMRDHVVLCGYGRMGSLIAKELTRRTVPVAVVELKPERENNLRDAGIPYLIEDATDDKTLRKAGLMHARALVTVLPHDADNIYVTLTARTLRPDLSIVARAEQPATEAKLKRAGASRVICPQVIGATRMVNVITRPNVVDFVDIANKGVDLEMDEYVIRDRSPLKGKTLRESTLRQKTGAMVIAIKRADGETLFNPDPDAVLAVNDTLILVGTAGVSSRLDEI